MRNPSFDQLQDRDFALTVACRACGSAVGDRCTRTDYDGTVHLLENLPAHPARTKRAARLQRMAAEENLTMTDDGLFAPAEIPTPAWTNVPVTALVISLYRGQVIECDDEQVTFTGTSRGVDEAGPFVDVHARDANGRAAKYRHRVTETVRVKAADK